MPSNPENLRKALADRIRRQGPVPVSEYMEAAVAAYYDTRDPFGADGDFTTAPEISQMFGEMIGAWLVDTWMQMGRPSRVNLVELGPGRGTLAADIMRTVSAWPDFKSAVKLHLVETSTALRAKQAEALGKYGPQWHASFSGVPQGFCFVVANEFFDALPVRQFEKTGGVWRERGVGYDKEKDAFCYVTLPAEVPPLPEGRDGDIFETSPASLAVVKEIAERIARDGGAALIIDYGHILSGAGDTLQAVSRHKYSDPLANLGEKDITAHVDFAALKAAAEPFVNVSGPVTQGQFLISLGIEARAQKLSEAATGTQRQAIMTALFRLVAPREMGRLFKAMALTPKTAIIVPTGFGDLPDEVFDDRSGKDLMG